MSLMDHYREDTNDIPCRATHCTHMEESQIPKYCPCCASPVIPDHKDSVVFKCIKCFREFFIRRIV